MWLTSSLLFFHPTLVDARNSDAGTANVHDSSGGLADSIAREGCVFAEIDCWEGGVGFEDEICQCCSVRRWEGGREGEEEGVVTQVGGGRFVVVQAKSFVYSMCEKGYIQFEGFYV